jgi:PAS domain S-box-containing protein
VTDEVPPELGARQDDPSWQRFRLIADNASDVVYEASPDGTILWVSDTVRPLLGWDPESLRSTDSRDLVHPDDRGRLDEQWRRVAAGDDLDNLPCRLRASDGTYRAVAVRARPVRDADGHVVGSVVSLHDTHEKEAVLRALATLSRANGVLVRERDEAGLLDRMCDTIVRVGDYRGAWYGRRDDDASVRVVALADADPSTDDPMPIAWAEGELHDVVTGRCLVTGQAQVGRELSAALVPTSWLEPARRRGVRSAIALPVVVDGLLDGVLTVFAADLDAFDPLARALLEDLAADLGYGVARLRDGRRLVEAFDSSVDVLAAAVESRDPYTAGHQSQVATFCEAIGRELGLCEDRLQGLVLGASIHDVGKIAVPHDVLVKPGVLTEAEMVMLRRHPVIGFQITDRFPWPWPIAEMIHQHHERMDGTGYPRGLRGEEILLEARIIAVADTFEAMAQDRPYRSAPGVEAALHVLHDGRSTAFDGDVLDAFDRVLARSPWTPTS